MQRCRISANKLLCILCSMMCTDNAIIRIWTSRMSRWVTDASCSRYWPFTYLHRTLMCRVCKKSKLCSAFLVWEQCWLSPNSLGLWVNETWTLPYRFCSSIPQGMVINSITLPLHGHVAMLLGKYHQSTLARLIANKSLEIYHYITACWSPE